MFTGLVEATGRVARVDPAGTGRRLRIDAALAAELRAGDSIAVNGVCLTVVACDASGFAADISPETVRVTTLGDRTPGEPVNLERPLRADARLGGHFVLGHVDGVGRVATLRPDGEGYWLEVDVPEPLEPYMISKGSIAVDGISLTIASLAPGRVGVAIVPFTFAHTTLASARVGDRVNLEADVLGKYVARLLDERSVRASRVTVPAHER
ncbi:MAG TPA: riboflavin synthase [Vicinamibacterales bacterium]|nr:riboflavin synthase [Vicinamibacterales bacterium]